VGINAVMESNGAVRPNTLLAKTHCKVLSLTRETLTKNFEGGVQSALLRQLVDTILRNGGVWGLSNERGWERAFERTAWLKFPKREKLFSKDERLAPSTICILLNSEAKSLNNPETDFLAANSIVGAEKILSK
jgi:hypothetical protein